MKIVRSRMVSRALRAALFFNALLASACAHAADFSQKVFRINPVAGEASPSGTLEDCLGDDVCQSQLIFAIGRIGGNPGQLAGPQSAPAIVRDREVTRYEFSPPNGHRFCRSELMKLSVAPSFGENATAMRFEVSREAAAVTVRLSAGAPRAWFDGILILISSSSLAGCTLEDAARVYECKGRCATARF